MDPVTAFSLVCGVIQVIDFGTKVVVKCRRLHEEGSLEEHEDIGDIAEHLVNAREDLDRRGDANSMGVQLSPSDKRLSTIARECSAISAELLAKIQSLKVTASHSRRETLSKVLKTLWKRKEIVALENKLNSYREALNTQILITLRQRSDLANFQDSPQFGNLNRNVQQLVINLADGQTKLEKLEELTQKENERTRQHIDDALQHQMEHLELKEYQEQLLESLWFPEVFSREEGIADAHKRTFEWILSDCVRAVRPWDNFVRWLESGEGTYWIHGKAGSGKSTLMSFVGQHHHTQASLKAWSGTKTVLTPRFYFWANGAFLEKSIEGLLRSLIWQILTALANSPNSEYTHLHSSSPSNQRMLPAWTERRLHCKLREITETASKLCKICFFIDGLDEFAGDQYDLIDCIRDITKSTEVKICLSSRSCFAFDQAFSGSARLRLQDLTRDDIRSYVTDKLTAVTRPLSAPSSPSPSLDTIISEILNRAEGVFLWVSFAVKDQILGLRNGDSLEQLEERIEILPSDVEGIYENMLNKIARPYRREAAIYLSIILQKGALLKDLAIMTHSQIDEILISPCPLPKEVMAASSHFTKGRIMTTCSGLLDVRSEMDRSNGIEDMKLCVDCKEEESNESLAGTAVEPSRAELGSHVDFMHRTAADFMQDSAKGNKFLLAYTPKTFQYEVYSIRLALYNCRQMKDLGADIQRLNDLIDLVLKSIRMIETRTNQVHKDLFDLTDFTFSKVFDREKYTDELPKVHWICHYRHIKHMFEPLPAGDKKLDLDLPNPGSVAPDSWQRSRNAEMFNQVGFLCLASLSGLFQYVRHCLELRAGLMGHHEISHLLFCATYRFVMEGRLEVARIPVDELTATHFLTRHLLEAGADPNYRTCSIRHEKLLLHRPTIWLLFLMSSRRSIHSPPSLEMHEILVRHSIPGMANAWQKSRSDCISSFVSNGADLNAIAQFWRQIRGPHRFQDTWIYQYAIGISVLSITEILLGDRFASPDLRDTCITKGARRFARCWKIKAIRPGRSGRIRDIKTSDTEIALTERESEDFFTTFAGLLWELLSPKMAKNTLDSLWQYAERLRIRSLSGSR